MAYAEVNVDVKYHRNIIGKGGQNINNLREQYKVKLWLKISQMMLVDLMKTPFQVNIRIPPDSEKNPTIRIEGDPAGVAETKKVLVEIAQRMVRFRILP